MRWLADENLHGGIVWGLLRRNQAIELVRAQDSGLTGLPDADLLEWAACRQTEQ